MLICYNKSCSTRAVIASNSICAYLCTARCTLIAFIDVYYRERIVVIITIATKEYFDLPLHL
jgi:hypothetical protein